MTAKKPLAVTIILLFIGLAIAPSINANVSKASIDSELVEISTEVCGLNGGKHTVSLSKEDAEEVDRLFDSIKERLDNVETREEAVEIFNEAIVELDKYGLLGGLSIKQAQRLVTGRFNNLFVINPLKGMIGKNQNDNMTNEFCLITGNHEEKIDMHILVNNIITFLLELILYIKEKIGERVWLEHFFSMLISIYWIKFLRGFLPDFDIGTSFYFAKQSEGDIFSIGFSGIKTMEGRITGGFKPPIFPPAVGSHPLGIIGFTGFHITFLWDFSQSECKFLGFALFVNLERGITL